MGERHEVSLPALVLFVIAGVLLSALMSGFARAVRPAVIALTLILGVARVGLAADGPLDLLARYHRSPDIAANGTVISDPEAAGSAIRFRFRVDGIKVGLRSEPASGDLLVTMMPTADIVRSRDLPRLRYGDLLLLEGRIQPPPEPEEFGYPAYLARQGIGSVMLFPAATLLDGTGGSPFYRWLYGVRHEMATALADAVPQPQAALGQAVLLGVRRDLPETLVDDFRATGTSHLLAISGLHVAVVTGLTLAAAGWLFGRRRQLYLVAPLAFIWLYALISGMSPSVTRAAIMGSVYLAALALGRPRSVLPALGLAAAVMVGLTPQVVWSVSFQLSFTAMAGVAVLTSHIATLIEKILRSEPDPGGPERSLPRLLINGSAMTIGATVATLPLVALHFQYVSFVGLPATLLTLPALPAVLVTHAIAGTVGVISIGVAQPFGWLAWVTSGYVTAVVELFARLPFASLETGRMAPALVWTYYGLLVGPYFAGPIRRAIRQAMAGFPVAIVVPGPGARAGLPLLLVPAVSIAALVWIAAVSLPDGKLHVTFGDVGQGDAILITTPAGARILVDGGPQTQDAVRLLGGNLPFWDRSVDLVVLTHPHSDHVTGLTEVLRGYDVQRILEREFEYDGPAQHAWTARVALETAEVTQARPGQTILFDDGVALQVLGPPETLLRGTESDVDNATVVLRLVYGDISFLLTGDVFAEGESWLMAQGSDLRSDVLKVAHHGSRSSSSDRFLERASPTAAVVSAGEGNRFGHPHRQTLEALLRHLPAERIFVTKDAGTVEFVTDGARLEVKTER